MSQRADGDTGLPALQRVVVHIAVRSRGEVLLVQTAGSASRPSLPWAVLRHGESPAQGALRSLERVGAPPVRVGSPLEVRHAVRIGDGAAFEHSTADLPLSDIDLHTVHIVLGAVVTDHAVRDAPRRGTWVAQPSTLPLAADQDIAIEAAELARLLGSPVTSGKPVLRQRLAAYAVVVDDAARILLTRLSAMTPSPGRWTLPGGGVDHGEHPADAAVREVYEETGMRVQVDDLVDVGSEHFTGRSPRGVMEDFHALRVLLTATAEEVKSPQVLDVGGSTDLGRWVPLSEAAGLGLVGVAHRGVQIAARRRG